MNSTCRSVQWVSTRSELFVAKDVFWRSSQAPPWQMQCLLRAFTMLRCEHWYECPLWTSETHFICDSIGRFMLSSMASSFTPGAKLSEDWQSFIIVVSKLFWLFNVTKEVNKNNISNNNNDFIIILYNIIIIYFWLKTIHLEIINFIGNYEN